jgi:uncharacterized protein involved in exopolysaccharide biosynthesis
VIPDPASPGTSSRGSVEDLLRRHRRFVLLNTVLAALVAVVVSLLLPKWYTARAVLLPPAEEEMAGGLSQLLPRGFGAIKLPGAPTLSDLFVSVLKSRTVGEHLVGRFDLLRRYRQKDVERALRELRKHTTIQLGEEGTISVAVEDRRPAIAASMANAYVEELDNFNRLTRSTSARRTRAFIEERLAVARQDLAAAEDRLRDYQQKRNVATVSPEARGEAEIGARLMAQKIALGVKASVLRQSLDESSEEVRRVNEELAAVGRQLAALPEAGVETMRLWRDLKVQEQVFELLTAQLEEARIRETRDTPTVQVLDPAAIPLHKSRPVRWLIALAGLSLGLVGSLAYLFVAERRPS